MSKYIKNVDIVSHNWVGVNVPIGGYYFIPTSDEDSFSSSSKVLRDITAGLALMAKDSSGTTDILDVNESIDFLKSNLPTQVITKKETDKIRTNLIRAKASVNASSEAIITIKVPGVFNGIDSEVSNGRFIEGGEAWFDIYSAEDAITKVEVIDTLNKLGAGAGYVIATYHDVDTQLANQGWYFPRKAETVNISSMAMFGFLPSEMDLKLTAVKGGNSITGTFFINVKWGKRV